MYAAGAAGFLAAACGGADGSAAGRAVGRAAEAPEAAPPAEAPAPRPRVVFVGTSLTAGLGVDPAEAYPALIQRKLDSAGLGYEVVNAGVSGETSAGALRRIDWVLRQPAALLVVETGANDGLRGQDPDSLAANIEAIVARARALPAPPRVLLVGMDALPNMGPEYRRRFQRIYPSLAQRLQLPLVPFLLEGVAGIDSLNQPDGIHPTPEGHRIMAATVWPFVARALAER